MNGRASNRARFHFAQAPPVAFQVQCLHAFAALAFFLMKRD
jgi:hypothetical protein